MVTVVQRSPRTARGASIVGTERVQRWMLSRAGIVNVYQYGNEILQFADGRLLLRGVNGSGKSTAMKMLLPWLMIVVVELACRASWGSSPARRPCEHGHVRGRDVCVL